MTRAAVRKFVANGEAVTVKDNSAAEFKPGEDASRWTAVLSTKDVDCEGDRVTGWKWDGDSVPLMAAHAHGSLPVGTVRPYLEGEKLMGELTFPPMGTSAASDEARRLVEGGIVKALSIGFAGVGKENEHEGIDFSEVNVKEVSLVGVGCCASAKIEGRAKCACQRQAPGAAVPTAVPDPIAAGRTTASGALQLTVADGLNETEVVELVKAAMAAHPEKPVECPDCGQPMKKGGKCRNCGYAGKEDHLLVFARNFVKCYDGAVAAMSPYPMPSAPPEAKTFGEIMEEQKAAKVAAEADRLQWAFYDSVRSILNAGGSSAVGLIQNSLTEYAAAITALDVADAIKGAEFKQKAGRIFSQANEAAMREVASMLTASLAQMHALLSTVEAKPAPEGEGNYGNVLDPTKAAPIVLKLVKPTAKEPAVPIVLRVRKDTTEELHERMLKTGRLPG